MTAPFRYKPEPLVVALCEASARGDVAHIAMLITSGANVDGRDEKGKTPIARAIENQQYDAVKRLLNHGASKGVTDTAKRSPPLFWATAAGDLQMVKLLLDHGCSPVDKDLYGSPYFCETVTQGNVEIVQLLLDYGANVNARDAWGREVLLHAYQKGNLEMMQLLQSRGASVNVKDKTGSPIIVLALQEGKMDIFHFLLARGADVNSRSITGTPLTVEALQKKRHDVFKLLLQRGADPNASNITGTPLLMMIVKDDTGYSLTQKYDLVHSLLSRGANPNICDSWGRTLMSHVVEKGCVELIQPLLEKGADPNQKTTAAGDTLLLYAIDQRRSDLIPVLLGHSANPNAADAKGRTPLVQALRKRDFATARLLLERGADANKDGAISPLAFASALGDGDTVRLLRNYGARGDDVDVLVAPKTSQAAPPIPQASAPLEDTDVVDEPPPGYDGVSKRT
ncbi:putative ankyrin repeat protein [Phialemonium atrogriseum]|uniref:Ankyrin repeat protein n=1 Tax=Phialemonium atrogriseum TaxID=1093897 RepID=A0AAJ0FF07_9PEZI|nr:putative ankyrin repeat protein [Phialemonium atrogriseum]KAK1764952.1 putative ankyrin repeat protein [Phialemonium atrogriseum]